MKLPNGQELTLYQMYCLMRLLKSAPDVINQLGTGENNQERLLLDVGKLGTEEVRTSIRISKEVWDKFTRLSALFPYTQKDLLSQALNEFLEKYVGVEEIAEERILEQLTKFEQSFLNQTFDLNLISKILDFIRNESSHLSTVQKRNLLGICLDVLLFEVKVNPLSNFYIEGHYFAGNMCSSSPKSLEIREKFKNGSYSLKDISDIVQMVLDNLYNDLDLEFILRNPQVVLRDDVVLKNEQRFINKGEIYYTLVRKTIEDVQAHKNHVLYELIQKTYKIPRISPEEIEKYVVKWGEVHIHRPKELNRLHLMMGGGTSNYNAIRQLLKDNKINQNFSDEYLDEVYYYFNDLEEEYRQRESELAEELNIIK